MATKVRKLDTSPPTDTAERPTEPITWPTMTMSAMLYTTCSRLASSRGVANRSSCLGTLPDVKSRINFSFAIRYSFYL